MGNCCLKLVDGIMVHDMVYTLVFSFVTFALLINSYIGGFHYNYNYTSVYSQNCTWPLSSTDPISLFPFPSCIFMMW